MDPDFFPGEEGTGFPFKPGQPLGVGPGTAGDHKIWLHNHEVNRDLELPSKIKNGCEPL